jgi:hypothetical protein
MEEKDKFLGCFISGTAMVYDANKTEKERLKEQIHNSEINKLFCGYVWGEKGIGDTLKKLRNEDYGKDMSIILFQFYLNPVPFELQHLKEIESYSKKEKAIGIPIIVNDENFFSKSERERYDFIKESIMQKMDLVEEVVKKKKLDTNMELLKEDLKAVLEQWQPE